MLEDSTKSRESIDLDFGKYWLSVKRRWLPAASIFAATVTLSALATTLLKPSYEAEGKLLFRSPSFNVVGSNLLPSNSEGAETGDLKPLVSTQNPISSQIEVISSPPLLQRIINELQLKNKEGEPLKVEELQKALTLKIVGGTDVLKITYNSRNPQEAALIVNKIMNLYLENDILTSRSEAEATRQFMAKQLPKIQADVHTAEVALRRFKEKNNVVDLSEEAKSAVVTIANLDNQINNLKAELEQANAQTNQLRQKVGLNLQTANAVSSLSQSPAVQGVLTQLQDTERQLAIQSSRFSDDHPVITDLEAKKANLQTLLKQQIEQTIGSQTEVPAGLLQIGELRQSLIQNFVQSDVQRLSLAQKLSSLYNSRSAYEQRVKIIPKLVQTQRELEQKLEVAQSTYQTLLKKVQELQVAENKNTANARIIAQALVPEKPLLGKKPVIVGLGLMLGLFLSTSTIVFLETRDKSLKTVKEVREIYRYTLLGVIPALPPHKTRSQYHKLESINQEITIRDQPYSLTSEMYRMIQANLKYFSLNKKLKTIVVTSAVPKEGKSTISANLAAAIAQLGHRVLLIDADMRVPSQQNFWQINHTVGLSEILTDRVPFHKGIYKVMDNLDLVPAGERYDHPLALISSKQMTSLIEDFSSQYDLIIIDAPPLLLTADAVTLSQIADGIILVTRPEVIDSISANAAQEMLKRSSHNILGLVVNGVVNPVLSLYAEKK